ncbi:hypothetical protein BLD25_01560 [Candidatus Gracilibacteria bacterium GN02-872]|nr:hypothetical protein BLD25_01560 [Candidatus Gracilibacteria bacterium GN02-872]
MFEFLVSNPFVQAIQENPIGQGLGIFAMGISIMGYMQKDDKKTIKIFIGSNLVRMAHFYFLGTFSAMASCLVAIARSFLSLKYKRNKKIFLGVIAAVLVFGVITYEGKLSILPIIASCLSAYGFFFFERIKFRLFMLISSICWLTFNIGTVSIGGIISESIVQGILIITMYKMIKEEGERVYFVDKIMGILSKPKPDLGRFVTFYDYLKLKKGGFQNKITKFGGKIKSYYKKANSVKIYLFKKGKKFIEIEN